MGSADNIYRPFDTQSSLRRCGCGQSVDDAAHRCRISDPETLSNDFVEAAAVRALFPSDATRRRFLAAVGRTAAMAAIHSVLPIASLQAMAAENARSAREEEPQDWFHPDHLRNAVDHGRSDGAVCRTGVERFADQDGRLGTGARPDAERRARCVALPVADAAGDFHGDGVVAAADAGGHDPERQRPGDHAGTEAQGQSRSEELEGFQVRHSVRVFDAQLPAAVLPRRVRARSGSRCAAAGDAAGRNDRQHAGREYRRLPRSGTFQPARGL